MTGQSTCVGCPLQRTCPYPAIFESPPVDHGLYAGGNGVPNPYVVEPPSFGVRALTAGELFEFDMVLAGRAIEQLPMVVYAWRRAFKHGLGRQRVPGELTSVSIQREAREEAVWDPDTDTLTEHDASIVVPSFPPASGVELVFDTPVRFTADGHRVRAADLGPGRLVSGLVRRVSWLLEAHCGMSVDADHIRQTVACAEYLGDRREMQWLDWTRYSSRQRQSMTLGGYVGRWRMDGSLADLLPWLWLGQWTHVGKGAVMGMGRYRMTLSPR
jgi:hypothetical protein